MRGDSVCQQDCQNHVELMLRHVPFPSSSWSRSRSRSRSRISGFFMIWVPIRQKSSGGRRPKKKAYHRVPELDRVMELHKKPSMILELKSVIQSHKTCSPLLLRDLEKNVGFVRKWDFMGLIQKYPTIFRVSSAPGPPSVSLTDKAMKVVSLEEAHARTLMEPILANKLRKLLMLCVDCRVPLDILEFVGPELGLPSDFRDSLIPKYPQFFSVRNQVNGRDFLVLEDWDSSLAVTAREARLRQEGVLSCSNSKKVKISRNGNYMGPFAFKVNFPAGFRPNVGYLEQLERWQKLDFPSPYLNARRLDDATDPARAHKRAVGVIHELLSLTIEKRMTSAQLDAFHAECLLPSKLLLCLIKHHGIFYLTNKGVRSTVFLKDAYLGSNLIDKCPLVQFYDKFLALSGRGNVDLSV